MAPARAARVCACAAMASLQRAKPGTAPCPRVAQATAPSLAAPSLAVPAVEDCSNGATATEVGDRAVEAAVGSCPLL